MDQFLERVVGMRREIHCCVGRFHLWKTEGSVLPNGWLTACGVRHREECEYRLPIRITPGRWFHQTKMSLFE